MLGYIKIDKGVLNMKELTASEKLILGLLNVLTIRTGKTNASNSYISEMLGLSLDTVKRALKTLKEYNFIEIENSNRYRNIELLKKMEFKAYKKKSKKSKLDEPEWLDEILNSLGDEQLDYVSEWVYNYSITGHLNQLKRALALVPLRLFFLVFVIMWSL